MNMIVYLTVGNV